MLFVRASRGACSTSIPNSRGGVCSELLTILATVKKMRPGIDQAFTTRCSESLVLVGMANAM